MRNIRRIYFPLLFLVLLTTGTTIHAAAVSTVINGIQTTIAPTATPATLTTETNSLSPKEAHDRNIILTAVLPEFTNINHVRNTAQSLGVGIDSLVRFRDDTGACELLLGTGSPDLSGIGAMIGYYVQAAFAFVVVVPALFGLAYRRFTKKRLFTYEEDGPSSTLVEMMFETTVWFSAAIAVGSFAYCFQSPAYYEVNFICYLCLFQLNVVNLLLCHRMILQNLGGRPAVENGSVRSMHKSRDKDKYSVTIMPVYGIVQLLQISLALYLILNDLLPLSPETTHFQEYCGQTRFGSTLTGASTSSSQNRGKYNDILFMIIPFLNCLFPLGLLSHYLDFHYTRHFGNPRERLLQKAQQKGFNFMRLKAKRHIAYGVLYGLSSAGSLVGVFLTLMALAQFREDSRGALKKEGESMEDDEWGFGQVMAVAAWLPFVYVIVWNVGRWGKERLRKRMSAEGGNDDEEAVPGLAADEEVDEKIRPVLSAESRSNTTATTTTLANAVAETDDTRKQY